MLSKCSACSKNYRTTVPDLTLAQFIKDFVQELEIILSTSRRGVKDVLLAIAPNAIQLVTGLIASVLIARGLGAAGMGEYTLAMTIAGLTVSLSDLGIGQTAIRYASRAMSSSDEKGFSAVLRWAFRWRLLLVFGLAVILLVLSRWIAEEFWHLEKLTFLVRLGIASGVIGSLASIPSAYFQSRKEFARNSTVLITQTIISFSGIVLLALLSYWTVQAVLLVGIVGGGIGLVIFMASVPVSSLFSKEDATKGSSWTLLRSPSLERSKDVVDTAEPEAFALYFLASTILAIIILRVDVTLMGYFLPQEEIGQYAVATRFALPLAMILAAINTALWPRASSAVTLEAKKALLKKTLMMTGTLSLLVVGYSIVVPLLAPYLFGMTYASSVLIGQLLCVRFALAMCASPMGAIGYSFGLVRFLWIINVVQLVAVILLNILLLPRIGAVGGAVALIVNEFISLVMVGSMVWRRLKVLSMGVTQ